MYGRRITGFHVGKGCKLLYLPNTIFTTSELFDGSSTPKSKFEEKERVKGATVVLSPLGNLVKVSVPFPCLSRLVIRMSNFHTAPVVCNCSYVYVLSIIWLVC